MRCVVIECAPQDAELVLLEAAATTVDLAGVDESVDGVVRLWLAEASEAAVLLERLHSWNPRMEDAAGDINYNETWQRGWRPIEVGRRFLLVPPGDTATPTPSGRIRLALHAGTAFGNGDHPTTQLCLAAMEDDLTPGAVFLDVGCGSGLLGEAALALGARQAFGCDLAPRLGSFTGSADAVRAASCDYVAANIQLGVLLDLLPELRRVLRPEARGVLSGVLPEQVDELVRAARAAGFRILAQTERDGWAALRVAPAGATLSSGGRTTRSGL